MPVWSGRYTNSDEVADWLQDKILMSDYDQPNSVTPVIADETITLYGNAAESAITQGLYSLGYVVPLALSSETTRNVLSAVAAKEIIYQLLITTDLRNQCVCSTFSVGDLEKLCDEYGETLQLFLEAVKDCSIVLIGERKQEAPCETPMARASVKPTSVGVISSRSCRWRPVSHIRF